MTKKQVVFVWVAFITLFLLFFFLYDPFYTTLVASSPWEVGEAVERHLERDEVEKAIKVCQRTVAHFPNDRRARLLLASLYEREKMVNLAQEELEKAAYTEFTYPTFHLVAAKVFLQKGDKAKALQSLEMAIRVQGYQYAYITPAMAQEMVSLCKELLKQGADSVRAHLCLGKLAFLEKDWTRAEAELEEALRASINPIEALEWLKKVYEASDQREKLQHIKEREAEYLRPLPGALRFSGRGPHKHFEMYYQEVIIVPRNGQLTLYSRIWDGAISDFMDDNYMESPYVRLEGSKGEPLALLTLYDGKVGRTGFTYAPVEASMPLPLQELPPGYKVFIGYKGYRNLSALNPDSEGAEMEISLSLL